jgi:hypothetical protein
MDERSIDLGLHKPGTRPKVGAKLGFPVADRSSWVV